MFIIPYNKRIREGVTSPRKDIRFTTKNDSENDETSDDNDNIDIFNNDEMENPNDNN